MSGYGSSYREPSGDWGTYALIALVIFVLVFGLIRLLVWRTNSFIENQRKDYAECKLHTTDLEWCFKQVYGTEVNIEK